jgi:hypothetical protein
MTRARVLTFHVDGDEMLGLSEALDGVADTFARHADFQGLLCLAHDGVRKEIIVIALWDGEGLDVTLEGSEMARQRVAATTDLGVSSQCYEVLRLIQGSLNIEGAFRDDSDLLGHWSSSSQPVRPVG